MQNAKLEAGANSCIARRRKALWNEIEIGRLDQKQPTPPEAGHMSTDQQAHAARRRPRAMAKYTYRPSAAREDRFDDGQPARLAIARRNSALTPVDSPPANAH